MCLQERKRKKEKVESSEREREGMEVEGDCGQEEKSVCACVEEEVDAESTNNSSQRRCFSLHVPD